MSIKKQRQGLILSWIYQLMYSKKGCILTTPKQDQKIETLLATIQKYQFKVYSNRQIDRSIDKLQRQINRNRQKNRNNEKNYRQINSKH